MPGKETISAALFLKQLRSLHDDVNELVDREVTLRENKSSEDITHGICNEFLVFLADKGHEMNDQFFRFLANYVETWLEFGEDAVQNAVATCLLESIPIFIHDRVPQIIRLMRHLGPRAVAEIEGYLRWPN